MFKNRLTYIFFLTLLIFSFTVITPLYLILYRDSDRMMEGIEKIEPLLPEQTSVHDKFKEDLTDSFISLTAYTFVIAFIASLFLSRWFLVPVRELYKGTKALKEGNLDVRLDVKAEDELGEVTKAFNEMADALKKKTAELLRKDTYVNTMLDPMWVVDMDNIIIDINPAFTNLFGYKRDEVIGISIFDFLDEANEKIMREQLRKRDEKLSSSYGISVISKKEGNIPVLISGAPITTDGEVIAKIGIIKDFRNEVALRDALKEEKDHTEAIMDSLVDILLVIDRNLRIVKANKTAIKQAGEEITGKFCHSVFHRLHSNCLMLQGIDCPVKIVFDTGRSYKTVHEHVSSDNLRVFHEITAYPVVGASGEVMHVVEVMRDITERKKFEDEIAQRNKELATLNAVSMLLSRSLKAEDIFGNAIEKVIDVLGMDGAGIFFLDEAGRELICRYQKGASEDFMRTAGKVRLGEDIPGRVAVTGQSIITPDILRDTRIEKSILKHSGIRGLAAIPIRGKEKLLGVFYTFSFTPHVFTPEEERLFNSIGDMTGIAFENIRLYEKMRELYDHQRQRRVDEQKNLLRLSLALSSTLDIGDVLDATISTIKETSKANFVWLLEMDDEGNLVISSDSEKRHVRGETAYPREISSMERYAIEKAKPVVFSDIGAESKFYLPEYLSGYNTACSIPVSIGDRVAGVIGLYFRGLSVPTEEDIFFLQTTASMLAVSIERSRLYEEAMLEKSMAQTILESITDGIMTVNVNGKVISANKAVKRMVEVPVSSALTASPCCDIFGYAEENTELRWTLGECLEEAINGRTCRKDGELYMKSGTIIPLKINSAPVLNKEGSVIGAVYNLRDTSIEREVDRMKTEFVKAVSHEFRTPLSAIVGMAEMLIEKEVSKEKEIDYLNTILAEGIRLSNMVSDLLDVARIESGKEVFKEQEINFKATLRDIKAELEPTIKRKEIKFSSNVDDTKAWRGDAEKIKQLLKNLIDNSIVYSDAKCSVDVSVRLHEDNLIIEVTDTGWGISEEDLKRVGEKFFRGKYAATTKGTGLGLSLCREIALMHSGDLKIQSTMRKGTTVTIKLPFRRHA
ncbi:MAG: PAS domain-containing protein [Nitrospirae bacterium]|nr:PAS domain-containing protein [Nitrospirota bacterium]